MNTFQEVWYEQVRSDHYILGRLRVINANPCHQLHYLQMVTEKLGKAYYWRTGIPPKTSHASFVRFLQAVADRGEARIAKLLGFNRSNDFENWLPTATPLAYALERLAPQLAGYNGPNPEYPWPTAAPRHAPAAFKFSIWRDLSETSRGRQLLKVIDSAVIGFPQYA